MRDVSPRPAFHDPAPLPIRLLDLASRLILRVRDRARPDSAKRTCPLKSCRAQRQGDCRTDGAPPAPLGRQSCELVPACQPRPSALIPRTPPFPLRPSPGLDAHQKEHRCLPQRRRLPTTRPRGQRTTRCVRQLSRSSSSPMLPPSARRQSAPGRRRAAADPGRLTPGCALLLPTLSSHRSGRLQQQAAAAAGAQAGNHPAAPAPYQPAAPAVRPLLLASASAARADRQEADPAALACSARPDGRVPVRGSAAAVRRRPGLPRRISAGLPRHAADGHAASTAGLPCAAAALRALGRPPGVPVGTADAAAQGRLLAVHARRRRRRQQRPWQQRRRRRRVRSCWWLSPASRPAGDADAAAARGGHGPPAADGHALLAQPELPASQAPALRQRPAGPRRRRGPGVVHAHGRDDPDPVVGRPAVQPHDDRDADGRAVVVVGRRERVLCGRRRPRRLLDVVARRPGRRQQQHARRQAYARRVRLRGRLRPAWRWLPGQAAWHDAREPAAEWADGPQERQPDDAARRPWRLQDSRRCVGSSCASFGSSLPATAADPGHPPSLPRSFQAAAPSPGTSTGTCRTLPAGRHRRATTGRPKSRRRQRRRTSSSGPRTSRRTKRR